MLEQFERDTVCSKHSRTDARWAASLVVGGQTETNPFSGYCRVGGDPGAIHYLSAGTLRAWIPINQFSSHPFGGLARVRVFADALSVRVL
jgi:hypothetical protein